MISIKIQHLPHRRTLISLMSTEAANETWLQSLRRVFLLCAPALHGKGRLVLNLFKMIAAGGVLHPVSSPTKPQALQ